MFQMQTHELNPV